MIKIIHFNDVYDIEEENGMGGVASFFTALQKHSQDDPLTLFSGDLFSPSHLSQIYFGKQMIYPINKMKIDAACFGNHDFDYDLNHVINLKNQTNFPWIMSNVYNRVTNKPLGDGLDHFIINKNDIQIGLIGLAEPEWMGLLSYPENIIDYRDYVEQAKFFCNLLKEKGCQIIIALTHMRTVNDRNLAAQVPEIDLILGGHDHIVQVENMLNSIIIKSGSNFMDFHVIYLDILKSKKPEADEILIEKKKFNLIIKSIKINSSEYPEDEDLKKYTDEYLKLSEKETEKIIGYTEIDLDTRFSKIRSQETPLGDFFADIMRIRYDADVSILNMGFLRSDTIHSAGPISIKTLNKMVPVLDGICLLEVSGKELLNTLEIGVSKWPGYDGRFPSVSGIKFTLDGNKPPMQRITKIEMDQGFELEKKYRLSVKAFLAAGKDGYENLKEAKRIIDPENAILFQNMILEFFNSMNKDHTGCLYFHSEHDSKSDKYLKNWKNLIHQIKHSDGYDYISIYPKIDGRLTIINNEKVNF